jgi:hypothetical protein
MEDCVSKHIQEIVESRDYGKMVGFFENPIPGEYVITGPQAGNLRGEGAGGWHRYVGYVVQVREKAGAFGSAIVLLRHPDGVLGRHENQMFHRVDSGVLAKIKALYEEGMTPDEYEDYSQPYSLSGEYPETGRVIGPKDDGPPRDNRPMVQITTISPDGSRRVEVV